MDARYSSDDSLRWLRVGVQTAGVQRFIRREGMWPRGEWGWIWGMCLQPSVWGVSKPTRDCARTCMHMYVSVCVCKCVRWVSAICNPSPLKSGGAGSTDVSLSLSLSEPHMKHRKRPLWSLPTCQSALHGDRLLRLLMCGTDRPETHT